MSQGWDILHLFVMILEMSNSCLSQLDAPDFYRNFIKVSIRPVEFPGEFLVFGGASKMCMQYFKQLKLVIYLRQQKPCYHCLVPVPVFPGSLAGGMSTLMTHPLDVVKTQMSIDGAVSSTSTHAHQSTNGFMVTQGHLFIFAISHDIRCIPQTQSLKPWPSSTTQ